MLQLKMLVEEFQSILDININVFNALIFFVKQKGKFCLPETLLQVPLIPKFFSAVILPDPR